MVEKNYITFGAQLGDREADKAVSPQLRELRRLLDQHCNKKYAADLDEFAPILRVDGDVTPWDVEG